MYPFYICQVYMITDVTYHKGGPLASALQPRACCWNSGRQSLSVT